MPRARHLFLENTQTFCVPSVLGSLSMEEQRHFHPIVACRVAQATEINYAWWELVTNWPRVKIWPIVNKLTPSIRSYFFFFSAGFLEPHIASWSLDDLDAQSYRTAALWLHRSVHGSWLHAPPLHLRPAPSFTFHSRSAAIRAGASCVAGRPDMDPVYLFQFLLVSDHQKLLHTVKRSAFYSKNHFIKII